MHYKFLSGLFPYTKGNAPQLLIPNLISRSDTIVTALLFIWLCGGLLLSLPNHGGEGLNLPQNLMTWTVLAIVTLWCLFTQQSWRGVKLPAGSWWLIAGVLLWSLPIIWSPRTDWQLNALPRVIALLGITGCYFILSCSTNGNRLRHPWLTIIMAAALLQAAYALWQISTISHLAGGRPYGIFQQVNVLASFLATGLICALWLFLQSHQRWTQRIAFSALLILPAMLVLLQSRAGQIGAVLAGIMLLVIYGAQNRRRTRVALSCMVTGALGGILLLRFGPQLWPSFTMDFVDKDSSTNSRMYMLKLTWQMIQQHPLLGNGYGSFEALFGQLAQHTAPGLEADTMKYPHNEILYAWMEGGIVALAGIVAIVTGMLVRLFAKGGAGMVGVAFLVPLAVHANLEYPFYQSATHSLVVIMLMVVAGAPVNATPVSGKDKSSLLWRGIAGILSLCVVIFMLTGLQTQQHLTSIEENGLVPFAMNEQQTVDSLMNPLAQPSRLDFDRHVALLVRFNLNRDPALLTQFSTWANQYLQVHNDPSVYASQLMISRALNLKDSGEICHKAHGRWPNDPRFSCQ